MPFSPSDCTPDNLISTGLTGCVHAVSSESFVIKVPLDVEQRQDIEIEKRIYDRLTEDRRQHRGLLKYLGSEPYDKDEAWAIRLRKVEGGQLATYLLKNFASIDLALQLRWAVQLADVLRCIHSKGVIHCDLGSHNLLLDADLNLKLIDFGGSSIDGSKPLVTCWVRNQPPWFEDTGADEKADIFALGSVIYAIMTGHSPYHDRPNREIPELYAAGRFPDVSSLEAFTGVIDGCWRGEYDSADEVLADVHKEANLLL